MSLSTSTAGRRPVGDHPKEEKGSALVFAIFVMVLLTGMGTALLFLSQSEIKMGQASLRTKQAFYFAEAGLEHSRIALWTLNKGEPFDDDLLGAAGGNGNLELEPDLIQPVFDSSGQPTALSGVGDDTPLVALTAFDDGWYAAYLSNDPGEPGPFSFPVTKAIHETTDTNDRVMITGVGVGPDRSVEVVQAIIEITQIFPSIPPATITILGPQPVFDGGTSSAKQFIGDDCAGSGGIPGLFVPVLGAIGSSAAADPCPPTGDSVTCGIHKPNTYNTGSGLYSGNATAEDVTDPGVIGGLGPIDSAWLDCNFLHDLADEVRDAADVVCTPPAACTWPPDDPSRVIFIDGDWTIGPTASGSGLVWVTGTLIVNGQTAWSGMLYVVGEGTFIRSGAGNGVLSGAMFVADIAGPDNVFGTADDCTGPDNGFDTATFDESGGGTGDEVFCTDDIIPALPVHPYDIVEFLQR